jgi:excinuclease ABC subunit C
MYEVIKRRVKRGLDAGDLPDLFLIDGGKGQLNAARAAVKDLEALDLVELASLAKSRIAGESPEGSVVRTDERVFRPGRKDPIVLRQNSAELFVLTRLRDEAHRFAITFHQKLRRARNFRSVLEEIPGVGDKRRRALLRHFGSLRRVRSATVEEVAEVEGFHRALAERVVAFLAAPAEDPDAASDLPEGAAQSMEEGAELAEVLEDDDETEAEELEAGEAIASADLPAEGPLRTTADSAVEDGTQE